MAKIHKIEDKSKLDYKVLVDDGDRGCCAVVAIAKITNTDVFVVQNLLEVAGRKHRCGTRRSVTKKVLEELGYKIRIVSLGEDADLISSYPGKHKYLKNITSHHPRRFPAAWDREPDQLMFTSSHVLALVGGRVHDWSCNKKLHVTERWYVTKK